MDPPGNFFGIFEFVSVRGVDRYWDSHRIMQILRAISLGNFIRRFAEWKEKLAE
jgi:hypothetical protein